MAAEADVAWKRLRLRERILALPALALGLAVMATPAAAEITLSLTSSPASLLGLVPGAVVTIEVRLTGLAGGALDAVAASVLFDPLAFGTPSLPAAGPIMAEPLDLTTFADPGFADGFFIRDLGPDPISTDGVFYRFTLTALASGSGEIAIDPESVLAGLVGLEELVIPAVGPPLSYSIGADTDADGTPDASDNCSQLPNPDQRDTNADGYGNLCDPDLNGDGITNFVDLAAIKTVFFKRSPDADLNGDGVVNFVDLSILKQRFFKPPGPSGLHP